MQNDINNLVNNNEKRPQKLGEDNLEKFMEIIETKFSKYDKEINKLNENIQIIKNIKPEGNILNEHVKNLLSFQSEAKDDLITIKIKLENLDKDISNNVYRIDKILLESVVYPGIIGNMSKFKTFHDFMDYLLTQDSKNITFRDKSEIDLKTYKNKIDQYLKNFSGQLDNFLKESNIFTKKMIEESEVKMKILLDEMNEKIKSIRINNINIIQEFEKYFDNFKNEIVKIDEIEDKIDKILKEKILVIQEENSHIISDYIDNKNKMNLINDRLNQLVDYIKDISLRTGKKLKRDDFKKENKNDLNKSLDIKEDIKPLNNKIKKESKIKKYIYGEINTKPLEMTKDNNINNNRTNKYINIHKNISKEKIDNLNNLSNSDNNNINKNKFKKNEIEKINEFSSNSTINYHLEEYENDSVYKNQNNKIEDKYDSENKYIQNYNKNKNLKIKESKLNLNKKDINIKKESYNGIKTIIPKTSKIIKNARKDINLRNIKNKQITYSNKPKNRNPKEIKKQRNNKQKIENKDQFESEEEEKEEEEKEEESSEKVEENLSCDDIDELSESEYNNDKDEEEISNKKSKYKKKIIRKFSKLSLPKIRDQKRSLSTKNSKIKTVPNNYKAKEKKIKYLNNKSRNNNIKNFENKNENNKNIFTKKSDINKKRELSNNNINKFINDNKYVEKQSKSSQTNIENKNYYYKGIIEEEDDIFNDENENKENIYSYSKSSSCNNNYYKINNINGNNNLLLTQNIDKSSNDKKINPKFNDDINIKNKNIENSTNNFNSEIDIKQIDIKNLEIKNLNRNIKNYIKYGLKLKDKYNSSLDNNSDSKYLSLSKYPKNNISNDNEIYNISYLNQKKNYNEYSNIKSRNKIINKNNNDLVKNIKINIINNLKNNTYHNFPKMLYDSDIYTYNKNQNMTIGSGDEYDYTNNLNKNLIKNKSTIFKNNFKINSNILSKMNKNKSAINIFFSNKIKIKHDKIPYKNKNYKNNFHKIRPNFSSEVGNNRSNKGFSNSNNSFINNSINQKNNNILDNSYNYYNYDYLKNMRIKNTLEKLDNNINVNEKFINSPIQAYENYIKEIKEADIKNNNYLNNNNITKYKNKNNNNNNIYNIKEKNA